jgi:hypothetical protein
MIVLAARRQLVRYRGWRTSTGVSRSAVILAAVALSLLLMPVSYKAGTEQTHPHTVFQIMVDTARGTTHQHGGERQVTHAHLTGNDIDPAIATRPAFLAVNLPLSAYAAMISPELALQHMMSAHWIPDHPPLSANVDAPNLTSLHGSSELATALTSLMLLLALLLLREPLQRLWFGSRTLSGIRCQIESPPPQCAGAKAA